MTVKKANITSKISPTILIIIGVTGDLSRRYLLPSIEKIAAAGALPEPFTIIGVTRQPVTAQEVLSNVAGPVVFLKDHLEMCQVNLAHPEGYEYLNKYLDETEETAGERMQRIFYLSIPPQASQPVVRLLGESGLNRHAETKLLLEKPFGVDLASAEELLTYTEQYFEESQIYRIDHYLAKEMAQNILVFREANPLLRHTWNSDFIDHIDIVSSEAIDVEGRAGFYEQTGALRDVMQSHVLQLAALTLMDPEGEERPIPQKRLEALRQLYIPSNKPIASSAVRGQYEGYEDEVGNPGSAVETFVSLTVASRDPRWTAVPIRLTTGKALKNRQTTITLTYRSDSENEPNQLILQIQPEARMLLKLWTKTPGYEHKVEMRALDFTYQDHFMSLPDAYEQVLVDAFRGDHTLFTSSDEVRESWRILEPVQQEWSMKTNDLVIYPKGADIETIRRKVSQ